MLGHSVGGFSGWVSSAQPLLIHICPHTVAKNCPTWKRLCGSLARTGSSAPGAGPGCGCCAPSPHVLLGLRPSSPSLLPQSQDLCTCCPPSLNVRPTSCVLPLALHPPQLFLSSRTVSVSLCPTLPSESCRWREMAKKSFRETNGTNKCEY